MTHLYDVIRIELFCYTQSRNETTLNILYLYETWTIRYELDISKKRCIFYHVVQLFVTKKSIILYILIQNEHSWWLLYTIP